MVPEGRGPLKCLEDGLLLECDETRTLIPTLYTAVA